MNHNPLVTEIQETLGEMTAIFLLPVAKLAEMGSHYIPIVPPMKSEGIMREAPKKWLWRPAAIRLGGVSPPIFSLRLTLSRLNRIQGVRKSCLHSSSSRNTSN